MVSLRKTTRHTHKHINTYANPETTLLSHLEKIDCVEWNKTERWNAKIRTKRNEMRERIEKESETSKVNE